MMTSIPDHAAVRGDTKLETPPGGPPLPPIAGSMPLYPSAQPGLDASFPTPLREHRFQNSVWQPTPTDPNSLGSWTPQGQFIQQLPHQINDLRFPEYGATYPQTGTPAVGYQQGSFVQTNGNVYTTTAQAQPSPHSLHNGNSRSTPTLNGNIDYLDQSPRPSEFLNGTYTHSSQDVMAPPTSSTPTSRCGSAQLETATEGKFTNPPTPTTPGNQGNGTPGYPLQIPPQSPQSSHNSSGYPGQEISSSNKGENKSAWSRSSSTNSLHTDSDKSPNSTKDSWHPSQSDNNKQIYWKNNKDSFQQISNIKREWSNEGNDSSSQNSNHHQETWIKEESPNQSQIQDHWSKVTSDSPSQSQLKQEQVQPEMSTPQPSPSSQQTQISKNVQQQQAQTQTHIQQQQPSPRQHQHPQQPSPLTQFQQQPSPHHPSNQQCSPQQQQLSQQQSPHQQMAQQPSPHHQMSQLPSPHHQMSQQPSPHPQMTQLPSPHQQMNQHQSPQYQMQHQQPSPHPQQPQMSPQHVPQHQQMTQHQFNQQQQLSQHHQQLANRQKNKKISHQQQSQQLQMSQHQMMHQKSQQQQQQIMQQQQQHQMQQQQQQHQHQMQQHHQQQQQQQIQQNQQHIQQMQQQQQHQQLQQQQLQQQKMQMYQQQQMMQQQQRLQQQQQQQQVSQQQMAQHQNRVTKQSQLSQSQQQAMLEATQAQKGQTQQNKLNDHDNSWQDSDLSQQNNHTQNTSHTWNNTPHHVTNQMPNSWQQDHHQQKHGTQNQPDPWPNGQYLGGVQHMSQWDSKSKHPERAELNNRLKTMILNKQNQDSKKVEESINQKMFEDQKNLQNVSSGNFLAKGHHPQKLVSEGGGARGNSPPKYSHSISAIENFVKYATSMGSPDLKHNCIAPSYSHASYPTLHKSQNGPPSPDKNQNGHVYPPPGPFHDIRNPALGPPIAEKGFPNWYPHYRMPFAYPNALSSMKCEPLWYQKQEPWGQQTEFVSREMEKKPFAPEVPFGMDPRLDEPIEKIDEEDGTLKKMQAKYIYYGDGGPMSVRTSPGPWCCRQGGTEKPTPEHMKDGGCHGYQTQDEILDPDKELKKEFDNIDLSSKPANMTVKEYTDYVERLRNNRTEIPNCQCFPSDQCPPEPGSYYTHLGSASSLEELRTNAEARTGLKGKAIRVEKIIYTGKEGKTTAGCPLAKWIIRRGSIDEKVLLIVKNRKGHKCSTAWIVVVAVAWEGVEKQDADTIYSLLTYKLNKFGVPTTRRCATNEPRTCACQGLDPDTCGASFSFGCSWSMYYNGCKYARSKVVRKFRLSVRSEEHEVEEKMQKLATDLAPLYEKMAPDSYKNQIEFEKEASDCRLGMNPGRPFSGVTACFDFCAHSHRDAHNMNNGCTVVVTLTKHRALTKPDDEQLHVLPLYVMDETDEYGTKEGQLEKIKNGAIESLTKFPCQVRVRSVPLAPCKRHGKKRKEEDDQVNSNNASITGKQNYKEHSSQTTSDLLQSSQVSSTVVDSPVQSHHGWGGYNYQNHIQRPNCVPVPPHCSMPYPAQNHTPNNTQELRPPSQAGSTHSENDAKIVPDSTTNHLNNYHYNNCYGPGSRSPSSQSPYYQRTANGNMSDQMRTNYNNMPPTSNNCCSSPREGQQQQPGSTPHDPVFRVPRGRPPSSSSIASPQPPVEQSTFIKPLPPPEHRYDRENSPVRDWDNIPLSPHQSLQITPHSPQHPSRSNGPSTSRECSPVARQGSQNTTCFNGNNQICHRSPPVSNPSPLPNHNNMYNNQYMHYQNMCNQNNYFPHQHPAGYSETRSFAPSTHTPYQDHNYGTPPSYPFYENFSNNNLGQHSSPISPHSNEQYHNNHVNRNIYGHQQENVKNGYRNINECNQGCPKNPKTENINRYPSPYYCVKTAESEGCDKPPIPNIKKEVNENHWQCSNQNCSNQEESRSCEVRPNGMVMHPPLNGIKQEFQVKREKDDKPMSQCNVRLADYPNTVFSHQTPPSPNHHPYMRPSWSNPHGENQQVQMKQEMGYTQRQMVEQEYQRNMLPSPQSYEHHQGVGMFPFPGWDNYGPTPYLPMIKEAKAEPLGHIADYIDNEECFKDSQMGGVAIALGHGSVLFECAKHELHATTALREPDRSHPTRISLVFYQHRNLNRPNHGCLEWEEKMRLRKLGTTVPTPPHPSPPSPAVLRSPTYTTTTWTTLFPMHPCVGTGPYQKT